MTPSGSETVYFLLVDDLEENLLSLEALLRRDGLVCLKARSGPEALEILLEQDIALALLDVQMPGMNGFELAELMRGTERTRRVPIIFLTAGHDDRQRRFRGYGAGAVDFLHKPIEPDILRSKAQVFFELYLQREMIARQRDELQQYTFALQEADRRKDEFLATLAHELRNPLAPIRNGLQIMRMSPETQVADEVRDMMDRQLTHMVRLIDDLLDVSRVSQGKIDLRKERITLQECVQLALETTRPIIEAHRHELTVTIPQPPIWIEADLNRLAQVISNLLNNAAKYTPDGGQINLEVSITDKEAVISVSDNGLGIEKEMLPIVFGLFTQIEQNLSRAQGGLGIGLALVKKLVELHGGAISADSAGLNRGSIFTVRLPTASAPQQPAVKKAETTVPEENGLALNVLVVDDNVPSAQTIGWMLELAGHNFTLAHGGEEAMEAARTQVPDVIMLDIGLPGISGYDVCRTLRSEDEFRDTIFIAQTGWGEESARQRAREAGFHHHLVKPVNYDELAELLANVRK